MSARPEFDQIPLTIYGYDYTEGPVPEDIYATGEGFDPRPDHTRREAVVKAKHQPSTNNPTQGTTTPAAEVAGLTLEEAMPQPPHGHASTIPGYPWDGHPHQAYSQPFLGPSGTSPMRRGSPQFMGSEGAFARAPGPPMSPTTGGGYAQAPSGSAPGHAPGWPPLELGGVNLGALDAALVHGDWGAMDQATRLAKRGKRRSREVEGAGGYIYRQYSDGSIEYIAAPTGFTELISTTVTRTSPAAEQEEWSRITSEIGTFKAYRKRRRQQLAQQAGGLLQEVDKSLSRRRKRRKKRKKSRATLVEELDLDLSTGPPTDGWFDDEEDDEKELPKWVIPTAVGAGALIFLAVIMSGKKG
jgi:hypothetical protein